MTYIPDFLEFSASVLHQALRPGDLAVDATLGNGRDAVLLAGSVGPAGRVFCFDIQEVAIHRASERLAAAGLLERVRIFRVGHERLAEHLPPESQGRVRAATFNLGFLPGSDRRVITRPETTLAALAALLPFMAPGGIVSIAVYTGHPGGQAEGEAIAAWCGSLDPTIWRVARYEQVNKPVNREVLYLLERLGEKQASAKYPPQTLA